MKLIHLVTATVLALGLGAGAAFAADPPMDPPVLVDPPYDWTGFYLGVHGGGGVVNYTGTVGVTASWSAVGWLVGGQAGYNWQRNRLVLGVDIGADWVGANGVVNPALAVGTSSTNWQAFARGKIGVAKNNWLFYGTAGLGVVNNDINIGAIPPINNSHLAGTAGVGFAVATKMGPRFYGELNVVATDKKNYNPNDVHMLDVFAILGIAFPI